MKYTVKEFAKACSISPQAVYQKINKGLLNVVVENGKKYIISDEISINSNEQSINQ